MRKIIKYVLILTPALLVAAGTGEIHGRIKNIYNENHCLSIEVGEHRLITREAVREPHLFRLQTGDLLLTYHVQPDMHFSERRGMRSSDGGRTWLDEPRRGHREQCMGEGAGGVVLAPDIYTFEREPGRYLGSFFRSDDGGSTFTGPFESTVFVNSVACTPYPTPDQYPPDDHILRKFYQPLPVYYESIVDRSSRCRGPSFWRYLIEHDGRWLAPMQCRFHGDRFYRTILVGSEDTGKTWNFISTIADYRQGKPGDGFCEPALMPVPDGSLLCVMRRGGGLPLAQCRSYDGGRTWSAPEMLPGHGVDPDLCLLSNGVLACTYGRPGLHIMFSMDGCGFSWGYRTRIGDWRSSTYMGIAEIAPGELLVVYDRNDNPQESKRDPSGCSVWSVRLSIKIVPVKEKTGPANK
jgi:hypothetical protein